MGDQAIPGKEVIKQYLGGYRHKFTNLIYHHSQTQTVREAKKTQKEFCRFSRETQTFSTKSRSCQSVREEGTITEIIDKSGKLLTPRSYITSNELDERKRQVIIHLQKSWRAYLARKKFGKLRKMKTIPKSEEGDENVQSNDINTMNKSKVALHKMCSRHDPIEEKLMSMTKPKCWKLKHCNVLVEDQCTQRIKQWVELYRILFSHNDLAVDDRLNHLLKLKQTVYKHRGRLSVDIGDLIDREADLLHLGCGIQSMKGLRKRISGLTLSFIEEYYQEMNHCS